MIPAVWKTWEKKENTRYTTHQIILYHRNQPFFAKFQEEELLLDVFKFKVIQDIDFSSHIIHRAEA